MTKHSCRAAGLFAVLVATLTLAGCHGGARYFRGGCDPCCDPCYDPCFDPCATPSADVSAPLPGPEAPQGPLAPAALKAPAMPAEPAVAETPAAPAAPPAPATAAAGQSLFDRIGGEGGVTQLVDGFIRTIATDHRVSSNPLVKRRMKKVSIATLRQHFIDQLCELTGGPRRYTGRDMKSSHEGLQISESEWDAGLEDLGSAMNACGFGERERREIFDLIRPMKSQIVEIP